MIKNPSANGGSIPGVEKIPAKGNSNPLQSCLGNPMDERDPVCQGGPMGPQRCITRVSD